MVKTTNTEYSSFPVEITSKEEEMRESDTSKVVDIGSTVEVNLIFSEDDSETITITIVREPTDSSHISVDSPLAQCILGKSIGFSDYYTVKNDRISLKNQVVILDIT